MFRGKRIRGRSHLHMTTDFHCAGPQQQDHPALHLREEALLPSRLIGLQRGEDPVPISNTPEVVGFEPPLPFAGMTVPNPSPETVEEFRIQRSEGSRRYQASVEVGPAENPAIQILDHLPRRRASPFLEKILEAPEESSKVLLRWFHKEFLAVSPNVRAKKVESLTDVSDFGFPT